MTVDDACAIVKDTIRPGFVGSVELHTQGNGSVSLVRKEQTIVEAPSHARLVMKEMSRL